MPGPWTRRRALLLTTPLVLALAACAPLVNTEEVTAQDRFVVEGATRPGGEIVLALTTDPDKLDPTLAGTVVGRTVFASFCEKLYDLDAKLQMVPQLASALPEVSPDGLTATIRLREGIRFNDGTPFDAAAVKKSLDRHRELKGSRRASELSSVASVEVVDLRTVRLRLSAPFAPLTSVLADRAGMVMSPKQLDALGENFSNNPVCVGPFSFVERVAQDRIVVRKSEHYYDRDRVKLEQIIYRPIVDANIRIANLRSRDVDVVERVAPTDVAPSLRDGDLTVLSSGSIGYQGITINVLNANGVEGEKQQVPGPLAADARVRRALSMAIDRTAMNRIVFQGLHSQACGPIPPNSEFATPATQECLPYDVEQAKRLLAQVGLTPPVRVEMLIPTGPDASRLGQVIQAMVKRVGFDLQLRPTEFTTLLDAASAGDFQTVQVGWSGRPDPDGNIFAFHTKTGSFNYSGAFDTDTDELIARARRETDVAVRKQLYEQIVRRLNERQSIIYLYRERLYNAHRSDLVGVTVYPDGLIRVAFAGFRA